MPWLVPPADMRANVRGQRPGIVVARPGKTQRDHRSGAWKNRFDNRQLDPKKRKG